MKIIKATAPATIANLGPGFDVVGVAVSNLRDQVALRLSDKIEVKVTGPAAEGVDTSPEGNSASVAVREVFRRAGLTKNFSLELYKEVPVASGLGSSGASAAAAAYAANKLIGSPLSMEELVKCAAEGERAACGSPHLDNVAPSLLGGFTLILDVEKPEIMKINPRGGYEFVVITPEVKLPENKTKYARELLPKQVDLREVVSQQASLARLITAILKGDPEELGKASSSDKIIEPARSKMIPGFREVKEAALKAGALGFTISGAGPSVLALTKPEKTKKVIQAIRDTFQKNKTKIKTTIITKPTTTGARLKTNKLGR